MAQRRYVTQSGDMWDFIAYRAYKRKRPELILHLLLEANPEHRETVVFKSGISLIIPDAPDNIPETLPPWKR